MKTTAKHTQEIKSILSLTGLLKRKINRYYDNIDIQIALYESGISIDNLNSLINELNLVLATNEELQELQEMAE